ncbi:MAG: hypothetical protein QM813_24245 [Verrucomicrobiota bacterium]
MSLLCQFLPEKRTQTLALSEDVQVKLLIRANAHCHPAAPAPAATYPHPEIFLNWFTMGIEPPSRNNTGS